MIISRLEARWLASSGCELEKTDSVANPLDTAIFLYDEAIRLLEIPSTTEDEVKTLLKACIQTIVDEVDQSDSMSQNILAESQVILGRLIEWSDPSEAEALYHSASQNVSNAEAQYQVGRCLYLRASSQNDLVEAETYLRRAIHLEESEDAGGDEAEKQTTEGEEGEEDEDTGSEEEIEENSCSEAKKLLARLLCQSHGRRDEAYALLSSMGYTHTLAHALTSFDFIRSIAHPIGCEDPSLRVSANVSVFDNVLPSKEVNLLQQALAPSAPFWSDHAYASPKTGFFSYQHNLGHREEAPSSLELILARLRAVAATRVPEVADCAFAEWWAHSR